MTPLNLTFKALADPTRREILRRLSAGDLTAGEIAERFEMAWPSVSHHLGVLKQAGLVQDERRGQKIIYSLDTTVFQDVLAWVAGVAAPGAKPGGAGEDDATETRGDGSRVQGDGS